MKTRSICRCLLCRLESNLQEELHHVSCQEKYSNVVRSGFLLSGFPTALSLTAHLRSCRSNGNGNHPADGILLELLHLRHLEPSETLLRDVLTLSFIPVLHATARQVTRLYPSLGADDTVQHLLTSFLETVELPELLDRDSHLAFAISRRVRRIAFEWARRETRSPLGTEHSGPLPELPEISRSFERAIFLRHFLFRCQRDGLLNGTDLELLVHIKLEGTLGEENGQYSNALRQRVKRLLQKLRKAAGTQGPEADRHAAPRAT